MPSFKLGRIEIITGFEGMSVHGRKYTAWFRKRQKPQKTYHMPHKPTPQRRD